MEKIFDPERDSLIPKVAREFITERLNRRWELFSTRIHITSFLLDHRFRDVPSSMDEQLVEIQFEEAEGFLKEFTEQTQNWASVQASWLKFREKQATFRIVCCFVYSNTDTLTLYRQEMKQIWILLLIGQEFAKCLLQTVP